MAWALLCALLLLLLSRDDASFSTEGEWCRRWTYEQESPVAAFQCPQSHDRADAQFCCGTCSLPICCSSGEARLDQRQCPHVGRQEAAATGQPRTTQPSTTKPFRWGPEVVFLILLPVGVFLWIAAHYCKEKGYHRQLINAINSRGTYRTEEPWEIAQPSGPHGLPPARFIDYVAEDDPSPPVVHLIDANGDVLFLAPGAYSQHANAGNPKNGCVTGPLVHRNVPGHVSETALETASSVDQ